MRKPLRRQKKDAAGRLPAPSGSPNVFSYYASRNRTEPGVVRRKASLNQTSKKSYVQAIPFVAASLAIIGSIFYLFWLDTKPRIEIVPEQETATLLQDIETYRQSGQEILARSLLNRTKLTINTDAVARDLQARFPELADVAITMPLTGHRLVFEIEPTIPRLVLASNNSPSFILDARGLAVVKAADVPRLGELGLPLVRDESGLDIEPGKAVLPAESITFITSVLAQLKAKNLAVDDLSLPTVANELHIRPAGEKYFIKFNMADDPRLQAGTYLAVREHLAKAGIEPKQYIDVRVEEKAFYK